MSSGPRSRHVLARLLQNDEDQIFSADREPLEFRQDRRNRMHTVIRGDTLWTLAERYFPHYAGAANLWWVIADYQDPPIIDPTIALAPGSFVVIPPPEIMLELFSDLRRDQPRLF